MMELEKVARARKSKTKKKGEVDRLINAMAQTYGLKPGEINSVKRPEEVGV